MIVSTELLLVIVLDEEATTMSTAAAEPVYSLLALRPSLSLSLSLPGMRQE